MADKEFELLHAGTIIPAHPLALSEELRLDEYRQRRLTRYYIASGAGGIAVGVHTTQFEIRKQKIDLLEPVLRLAAEEIERASLERPFIKVAGICGPTGQAVKEARIAVKYGYHLGLVSLGNLSSFSEGELLKHIKIISEIIPVFGFYLQPAVGGRIFSFDFWKALAELPGVQAIKTAPFNRYQTLDVVRAVCQSSRHDKIALYTGNDDNIFFDLLTKYRFSVNGRVIEKRFAGGLLGHWAVWTHRAVALFEQIKSCIDNDYRGIEELLAIGGAVTDMNAAIFDPAHYFKGSIAGIHEVLRWQGLLAGVWCLDSKEILSSGQLEEIDRVIRSYPHLTDDNFVKEFLANDEKEHS